ncbi:MAG: sensor histidine kinase [Terriglobia bacterium]
MSPPHHFFHRKRPLAQMIPLLFLVYVAFPVALGLFIWWFNSHGDVHRIGGYILTAIIYFETFGIIVGTTMRRYGPRTFRLPSPWDLAAFVLLILALTPVCTAIVALLLGAAKLAPPGYYWSHFGSEDIFNSGIALIVGLVFRQYARLRHVIDEKERALRDQQIEKERALKLASEARFASLESRIHPHFLFNTLNSISALTHEDPTKAEQMIQRLAALLRFSLDAGGRGLAPLREEAKIVRDYLEIEKARFGGRLTYSISIPQRFESFEIPPLALQTLVENSIKHSIAPRREGGEIRVEASAAEQYLILEVWDDGPGFNLAATPNGHGLDNLSSRLASLFGENAGMSVDRKGAGNAVIIFLPQVRDGDAPKS